MPRKPPIRPPPADARTVFRSRTSRCLALAAATAVIVTVVVRTGRRPRAEMPPADTPGADTPTARTAQPLLPETPTKARRRWPAAPAIIVIAAATGLTIHLTTHPDNSSGAACLSNPAMAPGTADEYVSGIPRPLILEDLPAPGTEIEPGTAMPLQESDEMHHDVSVLSVNRLRSTSQTQPGPGRRLVSVVIRERNTGQMRIIPQADNNAWLCDTDGTWYQHDEPMTTALGAAEATLLGPRQEVERRVVFQIREDARPSRVRIAVEGYDWTMTGDWKLG